MRRACILAAIILASVPTAVAQPFQIVSTPRSQTMTGGFATVTVKARAEAGFDATIFLSVSIPSLPQTQIVVAPDYLNSPYHDSAIVTLILTGPKNGGTHDIYIKGFNGTTMVYDTVSVTIPNRTAWSVYQSDKVGTRYDLSNIPAVFTLDKRHGIGWLAGIDTLRSFDGEQWSKYPWPTSRKFRVGPGGITIDSTGVIWTVFGSQIFRRAGTDWSIIEDADTVTGLTDSMLAAIGSGNEYSCIHTSPGNIIWISGYARIPNTVDTESLWILKYDGSTWKTYNSTNAQVPVGKDLHAEIITDTKGNLWISGHRYGLLKFDGSYWTLYTTLHSVYGMGKPIGADRRGWVWLDAEDATIQTNGDSSTFYWAGQGPPSPGPNQFKNIIGDYATAVDLDRDGDLWVGLKYSGIVRIHGSRQYHYSLDNSGLPDNRVNYLSVDDMKRVWIRTDDGSLTILDGTISPDSTFTVPLSVDRNDDRGANANVLSISPNPVMSDAIITVRLDQADRIRVRIVDPLGKEVALLADEMKQPGKHSFQLATGQLPAGIYFVQVMGSQIAVIHPLVVMK